MKHYLTENNYNEQFYGTALPYLNKHKAADAFFDSFDGKQIHYCLFRADEPKAVITIFHGFTENIVKYHPLIYVLLNEGFNVAMCDQRGHGTSFRYSEDTSLTSIMYFDEYVQDMEVFVKEIVKKQFEGPCYLFAHSMGGAIGALFLEKNQGVFDRALLNCPMVEPHHAGLPIFIPRAIAGFNMLLGKDHKKLWFCGDFEGTEPFETSCATSRARFDYYLQQKREHRELWNSNPSYRWTYESMGVKKRILAPGMPEKIDIPVLLINAELDHMVMKPAQEAFIGRVKNGRFLEIKAAKHETFRSEDEVLYPYLDEVVSFYS